MEKVPSLGFGLGLRATHYPYILEHLPPVDFFEIISENYMDTHGQPLRNLDKIRAHYPVAMHGVALSIGTFDDAQSEYIRKLKSLMARVHPAWITDHVCWTGIAHTNTHDLLPLPYTPQALSHLVDCINRVQDALGRPMGFENPSTYLEFGASTMDEADFLAQMVDRSGCQLLLDVNNVYVSCYNHRWDVKTYLDTLPLDRVVQIHLAGHANQGTHIIDTHDGPVIDPVWTMYQYVVKKAGRTPNTMIEWDDKIPEFTVLFAELEKAREAARTAAHHGPLPDLKQAKDVTPFDTQTDFEGALTRMQDAILLGAKAPSTAKTWIRSKEDFAPEAQLGVYIKGYRLRLKHLTKSDYPALGLYLGEEAFQRLLSDFVEETSSNHFNIARYSAKFPDFLKRQLPQDIFAHELCALENALTQLADVAETIPLAPQHLEGVTPEGLMEMHLWPRRALALLTFTHDIDAYFSAFMDSLPLPTPEPTPSYIAVFRHEGDMWRLPLEKDEYTFLQALFSGKTVGEAFEALPEDFDQEKISVWFSRWISNSMLAWQEACTH